MSNVADFSQIPPFRESIAKKPGGISEHFAIIGRISW